MYASSILADDLKVGIILFRSCLLQIMEIKWWLLTVIFSNILLSDGKIRISLNLQNLYTLYI